VGARGGREGDRRGGAEGDGGGGECGAAEGRGPASCRPAAAVALAVGEDAPGLLAAAGRWRCGKQA